MRRPMLHRGCSLHLLNDLPVLPNRYLLALSSSRLLVVATHSQQHLLLLVRRPIIKLVQTIGARLDSMH